MCGGFVMAYSSAKIDASASSLRQFIAHLAYNVGRISAYAFLGKPFGTLGGAFTFSSQINGYFYFAIGILMVLMGFSMMGKIKFLTSLEATVAFNPFIKKVFSQLIHSKTTASFYGLGLLNGFLPCGLVYFFLAAAATSGSLLKGGLTMAMFGVATMPAMLGLGFVVGFLKGSGFREVMIKIASFIIVGYGIYMAYLGYSAAIA